MFDIETRSIELAKKERKEIRDDDKLARELHRQLARYARRHYGAAGVSRQGNVVSLRPIKTPAPDDRMDITVNGPDDFSIFEVRGISARRSDRLDQNAMLDRSIEWFAYRYRPR